MVAAVVTVVSFSAAAPAGAQEEANLPADLAAALERTADTGVLTPADRQLIMAYPEVAARVADPAATKVETTGTTASPLSVGCGPVSRTLTSYTLIGAVAWRFYHRINRCWNGSSITSTSNRQYYFYDVDPFFIIRGVAADYISPSGGVGPTVTSVYSQQIENCVPQGGCLSTKTPRITLTLRGNGTFATAGSGA